MMHSWQIYRHPEGTLCAVKEGFNFWAFLLPGPWAIAKKLPLAGAIGLLAPLALFLLPKEQTSLAFILLFGLMLVYGTLGNVWLINSLAKRGYKFLGILKAQNQKAAEAAARDFYTSPPDLDSCSN